MKNLPCLDEAGQRAVEQLNYSINTKLPVREFQVKLRRFFRRERSRVELTLARRRAGPLKKIMDEVLVVSRFLRWARYSAGHVEFPLNDTAPDCWWWRDATEEKVGLEVTAARGKERYYLGRELDSTGIGGGFLRVKDDAKRVEYERAIARSATVYYTDEMLNAFKDGINNALLRKTDSKFSEMVLLVDVPLYRLPRQRWNRLKPQLKSCARSLPFREIYVVGTETSRLNGFRLK